MCFCSSTHRNTQNTSAVSYSLQGFQMFRHWMEVVL